MNLFNLACIVTVCVLTLNCANADDDQDAFYKQMRKKAKNCEPGTLIQDDILNCRGCTCVASGVIKCDPVLCPGADIMVGLLPPEEDIEPQPDEPQPDNDNDNEQEQEAEPTDPADDQSSDKLSLIYEKLRGDATGCRPGLPVPTDACAGCSCILPNVMRCSAINCLMSEKLWCKGGLCPPPPPSEWKKDISE